MTFYHFCADKHVKSILRQGITMGAVAEPTATGFIIHNGYMWLTTDPDPTRQSWATRNRVKYSRTAWRLTVEIPDSELQKVFDRCEICQRWPGTLPLFEGWAGSDNWRVFHGIIPKAWITKAERMEG